MAALPHIGIKLDQAKYDAALEVLSPKRVQQIAFTSVKEATRRGATLVDREVRNRAYISTKYTKRVIKARVPQGESLVGTITVSRRILPLVAYRYTALKRGGVRVRISKDKPPLNLRHAFVATVRTVGDGWLFQHEGHEGIFTRAKHLPTKGQNIGKGKLTARGFAGRFAIKELFGPSVIDIVEIPDVFEKTLVGIQEILNGRFESKVNYFASK